MTLDAVLDRVAAADTTADRDQLRRTVMDTIAALGLEVHPRTREVYDPVALEARLQLEARLKRPSYPEQQNVRWSGGRRR